jgi:hypothetical protein
MCFQSRLFNPKRIRNYSSVSTDFGNTLDEKKTMRIIKAMMAIGLAATLSGAAVAQSVPSEKVPAAVKSGFAKVYPQVKAVKWEKENGNYEASFKQAGKDMSGVFSTTGSQLESEVVIKASDLPASVHAYVKSQHKGANIKEASKITKASGEINYEAEVNGQDLIFDQAGKYLSVSKE